MTGPKAPPPDGPERLAELESRLAALESMLVGQAGWMSDMQREVSSRVREMAGMGQGLTAHTEWLANLERWVSSCVKTLANIGAQPMDSAEPSASGTPDLTGTLLARLEVATVMDWIKSAGASRV
jgi:hypothetical protein